MFLVPVNKKSEAVPSALPSFSGRKISGEKAMGKKATGKKLQVKILVVTRWLGGLGNLPNRRGFLNLRFEWWT